MYQKAFRIFKQNPWLVAALYGNFKACVGSTTQGAGVLTLTEWISEDMKSAMKAKDKFKNGVLRMLPSEFKRAMTSDQRNASLDDDGTLNVI